jgi:predicted TIM-barrel fold metal-dependent hydrolase
MAETGLYEDGKNSVRRPGDPDQRIKDMDRDGVDAEIIFGILGVASRVRDPEAANEMLRIYNDWLKDFCSHYPDRQIGLACLPYGDIDAAAKEVYRVAKLGLKGLELSCSWDMEPMWHPVWEPLWKAVNDVQLPLHFHTFPAVPASVRASLTGELRRKAQFTSVAGFQMNLINIIAAIIGAGVLERYPNLRIGLGESGIGWLPYALDRMDFEYEDRFRDLMKLKPSEYWRRQCRATFQFDRIGAKLVEDIGVETLMWGSDYPHPDGVWPESSKYDLTPAEIDTDNINWASNTALDEGSDFYVANRGDNTIVRMRQDGTVVAVRRVRMNGDVLDDAHLNGIATAVDGSKIHLTFVGPDEEQGGVLEVPAFS